MERAEQEVLGGVLHHQAQGSGTGLGLEILHRIVAQKIDAMIEVKSEPGNTRFNVRLP